MNRKEQLIQEINEIRVELETIKHPSIRTTVEGLIEEIEWEIANISFMATNANAYNG